jgi:hypothetical protein
MHELDWEEAKQRMHDHYMTVEMTIVNNASNTPVPITSFQTLYRIT